MKHTPQAGAIYLAHCRLDRPAIPPQADKPQRHKRTAKGPVQPPLRNMRPVTDRIQ